MGAGGITSTPKQREDVERQVQRSDVTRRRRERLEMVKAAALGDDLERIARWSGSRAGADRALERALGGNRGALAGAFCRGWGSGAERR